MKIKVVENCRGIGKHFVHIRLFNISKESDITASAYVNEKKIDSCLLLPYKAFQNTQETGSSYAKDYVLILPILTIKARVEIFEHSSNGETLSKKTFSVSPFLYKWKSRINYRFNEDITRDLRDYDLHHNQDLEKFDIWELMPVQDSLLIRGDLFLPEDNVSESIDLKVFSSRYELIESETTILRDDFAIESKHSNHRKRFIQFSIKILFPKDECVILQAYDGDDSIDGFAEIMQPEFSDLLEKGAAIYRNASNDPYYNEWFLKQRATQEDLCMQRKEVFQYNPLFSIITPLYNTPILFFEDLISCILEQSYPNWELILINASDQESELDSLINQYCAQDERIKCVRLDSNLGISENTNIGIKKANGDFIAFIDHDDIIEPDALFQYVKAINEHPEVDVVYCDEDKIDENYTYFFPNFKPDFSIDYLRSNNYISHMLVIRKTLLDEIPGSTSIHDGAQDYNLTLQASEKARYIHHIPIVLYHWRAFRDSTAMNADSKSYTHNAGKISLEEHLKRLGLNGEVQPGKYPNTYQVVYEIIKPEPLVSIIIPSKDQSSILKRCIDSIIDKTSYSNYQIVIIENNSTEEKTFEYYQELESNLDNLKIEKWPDEFNYSKIINYGVERTDGDYLILLNNDTEIIESNWIQYMLGACQREDVGVVGAKLLYPDNTIQHAGVAIVPECAHHINLRFPRSYPGYFNLNDIIHNLSAVTAACFMTKKEVFNEVGGFTEELTVGFNDVDYCLKLRELGYLIVYDPRVELYHYESASRGLDFRDERKFNRLLKESAYINMRWTDYYTKGDPFINPHVFFTPIENKFYFLK